jgi:hypothetical protein
MMMVPEWRAFMPIMLMARMSLRMSSTMPSRRNEWKKSMSPIDPGVGEKRERERERERERGRGERERERERERYERERDERER